MRNRKGNGDLASVRQSYLTPHETELKSSQARSVPVDDNGVGMLDHPK